MKCAERNLLLCVLCVHQSSHRQTSSVFGSSVVFVDVWSHHMSDIYLYICVVLCFVFLQVTSPGKAMKRSELNFWPRSYHRPKVRLPTYTSCLPILHLLSDSSFVLHATQCHRHTDLSQINNSL